MNTTTQSLPAQLPSCRLSGDFISPSRVSQYKDALAKEWRLSQKPLPKRLIPVLNTFGAIGTIVVLAMIGWRLDGWWGAVMLNIPTTLLVILLSMIGLFLQTIDSDPDLNQYSPITWLSVVSGFWVSRVVSNLSGPPRREWVPDNNPALTELPPYAQHLAENMRLSPGYVGGPFRPHFFVDYLFEDGHRTNGILGLVDSYGNHRFRTGWNVEGQEELFARHNRSESD